MKYGICIDLEGHLDQFHSYNIYVLGFVEKQYTSILSQNDKSVLSAFYANVNYKIAKKVIICIKS